MNVNFSTYADYIESFRPNLAACLKKWYSKVSPTECTNDISIEDILHCLHNIGYNENNLYRLVTT